MLLLLAVLALVALAPRIDRWLVQDACRAQHGQWDAGTEQCAAPASE